MPSSGREGSCPNLMETPEEENIKIDLNDKNGQSILTLGTRSQMPQDHHATEIGRTHKPIQPEIVV
jgi:hypothetical protein